VWHFSAGAFFSLGVSGDETKECDGAKSADGLHRSATLRWANPDQKTGHQANPESGGVLKATAKYLASEQLVF